MPAKRIIITNPIYNAVFKYLIDDIPSAEILLDDDSQELVTIELQKAL